MGLASYTNEHKFLPLHPDGSDEWNLRISNPVIQVSQGIYMDTTMADKFLPLPPWVVSSCPFILTDQMNGVLENQILSYSGIYRDKTMVDKFIPLHTDGSD